ncbi:tRNA (adenosine(37)-N6)-threonylcarbamoyltransferase complex ATPase subunit type 1 TsaE [Patescibacteria group bacterium]
MQVVITNSPEETEKFAHDFAKTLKPGSVIALHGELGGGKTTFTRGLAKGLGVEDRVSSPTFVLMRDYDLPKKDGSKLHHLDLYRINSSDELRSLDLDELVNQETNIFVIEWAEKADKKELEKAIHIDFEVLEENKRKITVNS